MEFLKKKTEIRTETGSYQKKKKKKKTKISSLINGDSWRL